MQRIFANVFHFLVSEWRFSSKTNLKLVDSPKSVEFRWSEMWCSSVLLKEAEIPLNVFDTFNIFRILESGGHCSFDWGKNHPSYKPRHFLVRSYILSFVPIDICALIADTFQKWYNFVAAKIFCTFQSTFNDCHFWRRYTN